MLHRLNWKERWCSARPWQESNLLLDKSFLHLLPESHSSSSVVFWGFAVDVSPPPSFSPSLPPCARSPSSGRRILGFLCCNHTTEAELVRWLHHGPQPQEQAITVKGWSYPISHTRGKDFTSTQLTKLRTSISFSFPPSEYPHQSLSPKKSL